MKRHVVDGAQIPRRTPEMRAMAPMVAFEPHLKQNLIGYPENIASHRLNLCTITWDRDDRGEHPYAVVETVDPESVDVDPLEYL